MADQPFLTTRIVGGGSICRRDVLEGAGGFDENLFFGWEDVELGYRIINLGYTICYNPSITIIHKSSLEKRQYWSDQRYYHYVKGRLYLEQKYNNFGGKLLMMAAGYLIKGMVNRHLVQACHAIHDTALMYWRSRSTLEDSRVRLTEVAKNYIREHETRYRGSLWRRLQTELLTRLRMCRPSQNDQ